MTGTFRKIIHIDCDCFYASVEMRDDPSLRGRPVAVGGRAEQRGVIATCNYEARAFGVRSAMATSQAMRRCPQLVLLSPRFDVYRSVSRQIHTIYRDFTALVEPLSLDEAYLDVSESPQHQNSATRMAHEIRDRIRAEVGITASAGIAPNKFVAKIASDWNKPDGQFLVRPQDVDAFVAALPVGKLFGVGKVTAARMNELGAQTCADLRDWPLERLTQHFGRFGLRLHDLCRGIDERPVSTDQPRRSLSVETTYVHDLPDLAACRRELEPLIADLHARQKRSSDASKPYKAFVKIRFDDFTHTTAECLSSAPDAEVWSHLLQEGWQRQRKPVRLLGVGFRYEDEERGMHKQLALFDGGQDEALP
ncbi:DNA polymerase IV [Chitinimonas koreensis]|uniref:DNA polymerase IV n=1 Tax=Chitinimonas koreensis TaxID=356302 RepID=UPI0004105C29|nr:DNA polymerase IV [Chitinimonas koreensis]QNM95376.1 DNA polymerase IV [Chitinimonas koreensis]